MNNKGFTLIELLATITVLAAIMLIAVTKVLPLMNKSRHKAFINDAIVLSEAAENKYADNKLRGIDTGNLTSIDMGANKKCYLVADKNIGSVSIKGLIGEYATTANNSLKGSVEVCYDGCDYKTKIWVSNNNLNLNGATDIELKSMNEVPDAEYNEHYLTCGR